MCVYAFTRDKGACGTLIVRKICLSSCVMCVCMHAHTEAEYEAVHGIHMRAFTRIKRKQPPRKGEKLYDNMHLFALLLQIRGFVLNNILKGPIETHFDKTDERNATILLCACCNNILLHYYYTPLATAAGSRRTRLLCSRSHSERSVYFCSYY